MSLFSKIKDENSGGVFINCKISLCSTVCLCVHPQMLMCMSYGGEKIKRGVPFFSVP